jgi:hypothetical protein
LAIFVVGLQPSLFLGWCLRHRSAGCVVALVAHLVPLVDEGTTFSFDFAMLSDHRLFQHIEILSRLGLAQDFELVLDV